MTMLNNVVSKDRVPKIVVNNQKSVSYALNLGTAANGVGIQAGRPNTFSHQ